MTIVYQESATPGRYVPGAIPPPVIRPETTYRLRVVTVEGEVVTAETRTPPRFDIDAWVRLDASGTSVTGGSEDGGSLLEEVKMNPPTTARSAMIAAVTRSPDFGLEEDRLF